jgi:hypothetical protein
VTDAGFACVACGAQRPFVPGTTLLATPELGLSGAVQTLALLGASIVCLILAGVLGSGWPLLLAGLLAMAGAGTYVRRDRRLERHAERVREASVLSLAASRGGSLTASDAAEALRVTTAEADATLTRLARDPAKVSVDVSDEGVVRYRFLDLTQPKVRVAEDDVLAPESTSAGATSARSRNSTPR